MAGRVGGGGGGGEGLHPLRPPAGANLGGGAHCDLFDALAATKDQCAMRIQVFSSTVAHPSPRPAACTVTHFGHAGGWPSPPHAEARPLHRPAERVRARFKLQHARRQR